ncbi:hypothetical protein [Azospirillum sp. B510]|uniref:hypothetical protein n=1 Tax=Alphaproteobacteria TaxID=28211 RepID=UPI000314F78E|nr:MULTISPECIES: hypothetical protein [Alphaproteobacteria]
MSITTEDIALGICDVTFHGIDLGSTKGGVEVTVKTTNFQVKADQMGETPLKDVITGTEVSVKVPMLETNLTKLLAVMPQAVGIGTAGAEVGVEIRSGVNIDLLAIAAPLKLHPTGQPSSKTKDDFVAFKAAPLPNFTFKYENGGERVYEVTFNCYPDSGAGNRIAAFGAPAAA